MDITEVRIAVTLISFVAFIAILRWAWSQRNQAAFDEAAELPFRDE